MLDPLDQILHHLGTHAAIWAYLIIFISAATEMLFPPFPGDLVFLSGMILAGGEALNWPVVFAISFGGALAGAWILYELGRWKGRDWFVHPNRKIFNPRVLAKIDRLFERYGSWLIAISRFLTGIRSAVPIAAGVARLPRKMSIFYLGVSIILWNGLLAGIGFAFGRNWESVTHFVTLYHRLVLVMVVIIGVVWGLWLYKQSRDIQAGE
jgi:membrane protein DedA with SNARE-associated domain